MYIRKYTQYLKDDFNETWQCERNYSSFIVNKVAKC